MLVLRILIGVGLAYLVLLLLAWLFQDRLAFPAPRAKLPDPKRVGVENGERVELVSGDGTKLVGWYLTPKVGEVHTVRNNLPQPPLASSGSTATVRPSQRSGPSCASSSRRAPPYWSSTTRATAAAAGERRRVPCTRPPTPRTRRSPPDPMWTRSAFTSTVARSAARWRRTPRHTIPSQD